MARNRRVDEHTADRLLSGRLAPEDAPPGTAGVAALFASAAVPADPADPDEALLTAMSAAALSAEPVTRRKQMLSKSRGAKIGAIAVGGVLLMGGTAAAANSGSLPDPVQDVAHDVAGVVGIELPESSNGLAEEVHEIIDSTEPGRERGQKISQAAHDRNEARKAARDEAKTEAEDDDESTTRGKSADAHEANEDRKAAREAGAEDADDAEQADPNAEDGADNAADPADKAADPAQEHLEGAQDNRP